MIYIKLDARFVATPFALFRCISSI